MAILSYILVVLCFLRVCFHKKLKKAGIVIEIIIIAMIIASYINLYITDRIPSE